jgi:TetR/AcrR family transcriptional regulator of autoinduction and epiphytic fitness
MAISDDKRGQILDAAVAEFQERGFAGASMDRIAERANVSKRTVYNHFDSKEALFRAILDVMAEQAEAALEITYDPSRPIEPQLRELGWAEGKLLTSAPFMRLARMAVGETMRDPALAAEMSAKLEKISVFHEFVEAAQADGAISAPDPARASDQFLGLIKSQAFWPVVFTGQVVCEDEMERIIQSTVEMFLRSYRARSGP